MSLLMALLLACGRAPAPAPAPTPTPTVAPREAVEAVEAEEIGNEGSEDMDGAAPGELPLTLAGAPIDGIRYWAPLGSLDGFLGELRASGFPVPARRVEVSTMKELIQAVASDTLIVVKPGTYRFEDSNLLGGQGEEGEDVPAMPDWSSLSPHYVDGRFRGVKNLLIVNGGSEPVRIVQPDGYAPAFHLEQVENVALYGLTLGHRPEKGFCMGDVLRVVEAKNVVVSHSTLFGSGTEGLTAITVDGLRLVDSVITDCTQGYTTLSNSRRLVFERVKVAGNRDSLLRGFAIYRSEVTMRGTVIEDNTALTHSADPSMSYLRLFSVDGDFDQGKWHVDAPRALDPERTESTVRLEGVTVDGASVSWPPG